MNSPSPSPAIAATTARCAGVRCRRPADRPDAAPVAPARVPDGGRLCRSCTDLLVSQAGRLPALFVECGRRLGAPGERRGERVSGGAVPTGMPFNTAAAEARSAIVGVLSSWSALIADGRRITGPRRDVGSMAAFLVGHADWLRGHEAAGDGSRELDQLTRQARRVVEPEERSRVRVGACVEPGCAGDLVALVRKGQRRSAHTEVRCSHVAGHRWSGHEWLQLGSRMARARERANTAAGLPAPAPRHAAAWLTATDIAELWGIPTGSVYRHASEQNWTRRRLAGRTYYGTSDVQATLNQ